MNADTPLVLPPGIVINQGSDEYCGTVMHCLTCWEWSWTWHPKPEDAELLAMAEDHLTSCIAVQRGLA